MLLETIKQSNEPREIKERSKKYVVGIIGDLNNRKKKAAAHALQAQQQQALQSDSRASTAKRASDYASPDQYTNGVGLGKENNTNGHGSASLAARGKPRHDSRVRETEGFVGEG